MLCCGSFGIHQRSETRHNVQENVSESLDCMCTILRVHGFCLWNAGTQVQAQQHENQPNRPIHSAVIKPAMTKHLCWWM